MDHEKTPGELGSLTGANNNTDVDSTAPLKHKAITAQRAALLMWLLAHQRISTLQARNELGIMHPAARIQELRDAGNDIATIWQWEADATGKAHKQGLYVLLPGKGARHE